MTSCPFCLHPDDPVMIPGELAVAFRLPKTSSNGDIVIASRRHVCAADIGSDELSSMTQLLEQVSQEPGARPGEFREAFGHLYVEVLQAAVSGEVVDAEFLPQPMGDTTDSQTDNDHVSIASSIRAQFEKVKAEFDAAGGAAALKSGEWLSALIGKSFKNYWDSANVEYFRNKYEGCDRDEIARKLIHVTAKNAAILGGIVGAAISVDEVATLTTLGGGGIGLPASVSVAVTAFGSELFLLTRFQLQLVASLAKLYDVPLDPHDPEDILTILAFALGGKTAEAAGVLGMRVGGRAAGRAAKAVFRKELLSGLKDIGQKVGVKILQRSIVKYAIPMGSILIGSGWNYFSTQTVGKIAIEHFETLSTSP